MGQGVERVLPEEAVLDDPIKGRRKRRRIEVASSDAPFWGLLEKSRLLQDPKVLGDGGQAHVVRSGQIAHAAIPFREPRDDGASNGVRKGHENRVQVRATSLNHLVN
jgi:hypothetical protein